MKIPLIILFPMVISSSAFADQVSEAAEYGRKFVKATEYGKRTYRKALCASCHGLDGDPGNEMREYMKGVNFNNSKVLHDSERTALVLLKGIEWHWDESRGEGQTLMMGWYSEEDPEVKESLETGATKYERRQDLANLITYLRFEFGEDEELITVEQVEKWKEKHANIPAINFVGYRKTTGGVPREVLLKINAAGKSNPGAEAEASRNTDKNDESMKERERGMRLARGELSVATSEQERFYALGEAAKNAFQGRKIKEAEALARELLELAPKFRNDWNYGNAIAEGNLVLGRIALSRNDIAEAKRCLLASAESHGSDILDSIGPDFLFAGILVRKGEGETVIAYLDSVAHFWANPDERAEAYSKAKARERLKLLEIWKEEIRSGEVPYSRKWR